MDPRFLLDVKMQTEKYEKKNYKEMRKTKFLWFIKT